MSKENKRKLMEVRTTTTTENHYPVQPICGNHYDYLSGSLELEKKKEDEEACIVQYPFSPHFSTEKYTHT